MVNKSFILFLGLLLVFSAFALNESQTLEDSSCRPVFQKGIPVGNNNSAPRMDCTRKTQVYTHEVRVMASEEPEEVTVTEEASGYDYGSEEPGK